MSDCLTAAMKLTSFDLHECVDCEHYCRECDTCCNGVPDHQDCMFRCWVPSRAYEIKQRHQQLEQVAKELMQYIEFLESKHDVQPTSIKAQMYQKLHKLGVSLDE